MMVTSWVSPVRTVAAVQTEGHCPLRLLYHINILSSILLLLLILLISFNPATFLAFLQVKTTEKHRFHRSCFWWRLFHLCTHTNKLSANVVIDQTYFGRAVGFIHTHFSNLILTFPCTWHQFRWMVSTEAWTVSQNGWTFCRIQFGTCRCLFYKSEHDLNTMLCYT